jgi:prepilin-type N-terminal cleavage/methylation domain-containing protein/prepilin-type processing-associated H-X9-DG protein
MQNHFISSADSVSRRDMMIPSAARGLITQNSASPNCAFTLIELLVVITIIGILISLSGAVFSKAKRKTQRVVCANNLKQLNLAAFVFAEDQPGEPYSMTFSDGNDRQSWLYPHWIPSLKTFSCPGGMNEIRTQPLIRDPGDQLLKPADLEYCAWERGGFGSSYEVFGFMGYNQGQISRFKIGEEIFETQGVRKTFQTVQTYQRKSAVMNMVGAIPGPSRIWLILDGDEASTEDAVNNYPDTGDNHYSGGANVSFCDGHVEWVPRSDYIRSYEISQDENRGPLQIDEQP